MKIQNLMSEWPALSDRKLSVDHFRKKYGFRHVPVEIGKRYTDEDWTQTIMTINEFIERFIESNTSGTKGYLAQHQLLDQVKNVDQKVWISRA